MTDVLILHATLPGEIDAGPAAALLARLPYARRLELERRDAAARLASLAGTALVLAGAGRLRGRPVELAKLRFPLGGKPMLTGGPWFSISHSVSRVAVALSDCSEVGLDLEDAMSGAGAVGSEATGSLGRWTATEAVLKAIGAGIRSAGDVRLSADRSIAQLDGEVLYLRPLALAEDCVACLATRGAMSRLSVEEVGIPWSCAT